MKRKLLFALSLIVILVMFGSLREHKPQPCASGKLLRKIYYKSRLIHQEYFTGVYGTHVANSSEESFCIFCGKGFKCDSITIEMVK